MKRWIITLLILWTPWALGEEVTNTNGDDIGIKIMGSIIQKIAENNVALVKINGSVVSAVKRGHVIDEKYKVIHITATYIELINKQAHRYFVFLDKFNSNSGIKDRNVASKYGDIFTEDGFERNEGKIVMTTQYRDKLLKQDMATVLMQATAEPVMDGGNIIGFKMSQIDEGSIYDKSGLKNGDVIKFINGNELNSVAGSITLLRSLKSESSFELEIMREGTLKKFNLEVK